MLCYLLSAQGSFHLDKPSCHCVWATLESCIWSPQPPPKSLFLLFKHPAASTHTHLGKDAHRLAHQDKVFSAQACRVQQGKADCTPPRTSPPSVPCQGHSQGTARILVPYEDDTVCTVCVAVLNAQPSSWCFRLLLQTSALVAGKLE